ncbi:MAG: nitronate monooxygenase [Candidatus Rokubacteria bacterium]|nr:nitronate monooxygenase [Candidatus Rokubacteria bacterium]
MMSPRPVFYKKALLEQSADATTVTDALSGRYARVMRNEFTDRYAKSGAPVLPFLWQANAAADIYQKAAADGNPGYVPMWAGQSVGLVHNLPGAGEVVESIIREARQLLVEQFPLAVKLSE